MPDSLLGLALFVALLAPGMAYVITREALYPRREASGFRETALAVLTGIACNTMALGYFALVRWRYPKQTPDVGVLINHPKLYIVRDLPELATLAALLLILAAALGVVAAGTIPPNIGRITTGSAWYKSFDGRPDKIIYVGCELDDGTYIAGHLKSYSEDANEIPDREIVLNGDISYRPPRGMAELLPISRVIISARQIRYLTVTYIPAPTDAPVRTEGR